MVQETYAKGSALLIATLCIVLCFFDIPASSVGIYNGAPLTGVLLYSLFHVNFFHAVLNAWALLCMVFYYKAPLWQLVVAYLIAVSFATTTIPCPLTIGMSGVVFALFGMTSFRVIRFVYWQVSMALTIALGFIIPNMNGYLHLYCYAVGVAVGYLHFLIGRR